jgi:hypothetical protein
MHGEARGMTEIMPDVLARPAGRRSQSRSKIQQTVGVEADSSRWLPRSRSLSPITERVVCLDLALC